MDDRCGDLECVRDDEPLEVEVIGWWIGVFRQTQGGSAPAEFDSAQGARLAVWQTGVAGLDWLHALTREGRATDLGGNGYPLRFTARFKDLIKPIEAGPPEANAIWVHGADDVIDHSKWDGQTTVHHAVVRACSPEEWLIVEAWDES